MRLMCWRVLGPIKRRRTPNCRQGGADSSTWRSKRAADGAAKPWTSCDSWRSLKPDRFLLTCGFRLRSCGKGVGQGCCRRRVPSLLPPLWWNLLTSAPLGVGQVETHRLWRNCSGKIRGSGMRACVFVVDRVISRFRGTDCSFLPFQKKKVPGTRPPQKEF